MTTLVEAPERDYCMVCGERPSVKWANTCSEECEVELQNIKAEAYHDDTKRQEAEDDYERWQREHGR